MIVASFYAPRPQHKFFQDYTPFLRILDESVRRFGHEHVVLSDRKIEGFKTHYIDLPDNLMRACLYVQAHFLANADDDVLLVGADCVMANDWAEAPLSGADVAVTVGPFADCILNTGTMWVRKDKCLEMAKVWFRAVDLCKGEWGDDQRALREALDVPFDCGTHERPYGKLRVFPVDPYNLAPQFPADARPDAYVLHFRGDRKSWMADYCATHLGFGKAPEVISPEPSVDDLLANMRANCRHELPAVKLEPAHDGHAVICGSGPSLVDDLDEIKWRQQHSQVVFAINGAADFLRDHGIVPDWLVVMDKDPACIRFIERRSAVRFLMGSQADPSLVDSLVATGHDVTLFHLNLPGAAEIVRKGLLCGGAQTAGLTLPFVVEAMGYRKVHLFGLDSSDRKGAHAYEEPEGDRAISVEAWVGRERFTGSVAMVNQARAFPDVAKALTDRGVLITVHGSGLLPALAKQLETEFVGA